MYKFQTAVVVAFLLLAICCKPSNVAAKPIAHSELTRQWWLAEMFGGPVGAVTSPITLTLEKITDNPANNGTIPLTSEARAYGSAGCNGFMAYYTIGLENRLQFNHLATTRTYCEGPTRNDHSIMQPEYKFVNAIEQVVRYEITEVDGKSTLVLFNDSDEGVLTFASELPIASELPLQRIFLPTVMR